MSEGLKPTLTETTDAYLTAVKQMSELAALRTKLEEAERERDDCKADMLRLHEEKMNLWESIHFLDGYRDKLIAADRRIEEAERKLAEARRGFMLLPVLPDALKREYMEEAAKMVDHILKEGGGTYGDAIRAKMKEVK